ncbi:uncharacterized protein BDR25DRAFT_350019 [Lindgomyces ingoldianus]|uniref:Uncharacterized protein n=1 Tax=Lindgomyces ingoldianus TaxID=673940 RepID=A0ACB6R988_9PLEO|nr:uncharacterized protein BDR25DRAFT_350019 [Lindgomyces ingoldianus]KAF2475741.1 hypothetical protein BDR25DRAFT_350019 [Lindgomyces ingoldianus]
MTTFLDSASRLHILMLNAGIMGDPNAVTKEGYELGFGANHMGHALLARPVMPPLKSAPHSSASNHGTNYQYPQLTTLAIDPGSVKADLFQPNGVRLFIPFFMAVEEGAKSYLWASTANGMVSGEYYDPIELTGNTSALSEDKGFAKKLWAWTEKELSYLNCSDDIGLLRRPKGTSSVTPPQNASRDPTDDEWTELTDGLVDGSSISAVARREQPCSPAITYNQPQDIILFNPAPHTAVIRANHSRPLPPSLKLSSHGLYTRCQSRFLPPNPLIT